MPLTKSNNSRTAIDSWQQQRWGSGLLDIFYVQYAMLATLCALAGGTCRSVEPQAPRAVCAKFVYCCMTTAAAAMARQSSVFCISLSHLTRAGLYHFACTTSVPNSDCACYCGTAVCPAPEPDDLCIWWCTTYKSLVSSAVLLNVTFTYCLVAWFACSWTYILLTSCVHHRLLDL